MSQKTKKKVGDAIAAKILAIRLYLKRSNKFAGNNDLRNNTTLLQLKEDIDLIEKHIAELMEIFGASKKMEGINGSCK